jgi:hypothetical protein
MEDPQQAEEEEDEELREIDQYESGVHPTQQQPEMHPHTHTEEDIAALMTRLAIAEACHVPHTYYSPESSLYQAAVDGELYSSQIPYTRVTLPHPCLMHTMSMRWLR